MAKKTSLSFNTFGTSSDDLVNLMASKTEQTSEEDNKRVYTTEIIKDFEKRYEQNYDIDWRPFYNKNIKLRAPNVSFQLSDDEMEEYLKCFDDPIYFVEKHCKFKTDNGYQYVKLYDFQKEIVSSVTDYEYHEEKDLLVPKNRNVIIMSSRQNGKCVAGDTNVNIKEKYKSYKTTIQDFYNERTKKNGFWNGASKWLRNIYSSISFKDISRLSLLKKIIIGKLLQWVEEIDTALGYVDTDENNVKKFREIVNIDSNYHIETDSGYKYIPHLFKTIPYQVYLIRFTDNTYLETTDDHIVFKYGMEETFVKELKSGDLIIAKGRNKVVKSVKKMPYKHSMYDFMVNDTTKRYYTNDILSHNTTTTVAFLAWVMCFKSDKNIAVMANKRTTSVEICSKLINVFSELPYFLKPGCLSFTQESIHLDNGCKLMSSATTNTAQIGFTIDILYLDEFAHVPTNIAYDFWRSVYPTLSSLMTSQCIITSTPNGTQNKFFDLWDLAVKSQNSFLPLKYEWWRVPSRDKAWADKARKDYGEEEFEQEFNLSFSVSSKILLKNDDLKFMEKISREYVTHKFDNLDDELSDCLYWHPDFNPYAISPNDRFILSIDTAEGSDDGTKKAESDYNVMNIFKVCLMSPRRISRNVNNKSDFRDCFYLKQVGIYLDNNFDEVNMATVCKYFTFDICGCGIGFTDNVRLLVEINFNGKNFLTNFRNDIRYYGALVFNFKHRQDTADSIAPYKEGFKVSHSNREFYLKGGAMRMSKKYIVISHNNIKKKGISSIYQLQNFGKTKNKYEGIACHDDISMTILNLSRLWDCDEYLMFISDYISTLPMYIQERISNILEHGGYVNSNDEESSFTDYNSNMPYMNMPNGLYPNNGLNYYGGYSQMGYETMPYGYTELMNMKTNHK